MLYDILIIGGGPAGLTAATYARRAGKSVLVIEKNAFGGQITWSPRVENFPGFLSVTGTELGDKLLEQAMEQGAEVEREEELVGSGVCYCAGCDGAFFAGQDVAVCGGGNAALQDALLLSETCSHVTLIHRRADFRGEQRLVEALKERENVTLLMNARVTALLGNRELVGLEAEQDGVLQEIKVTGLFVAVGHQPDNGIFAELVTLDGAGYAASGEDCATKSAGVFVAGDCRAKGVRQLTTAVADGAVAALAACRYLDA